MHCGQNLQKDLLHNYTGTEIVVLMDFFIPFDPIVRFPFLPR